jgi:hypothetical protein
MFDIPRFYISACSNSVQLVPLYPCNGCYDKISHERKQYFIEEMIKLRQSIESQCVNSNYGAYYLKIAKTSYACLEN